MIHSLCVRRERRKSRCGPSGNSRWGASGNSREVSQCFFCWQRLFAASAPVFYPGSPSKIVLDSLYIYRDELPISITYILSLDLRFFVVQWL